MMVVLGCGSGSPGPADSPASPTDPGGAWERIVYGIPVTDAEGRPLEHPFLGGFNLPRPQLADVDGDQDLDLFLQELSDEVMLFDL